MKTLFCAIAFTSGSTRALLTKDGKILDRFFSTAHKTDALEEFSHFLAHNLLKVERLSCVVITGYGRGRMWTQMKTFFKKKDPHSLFFDILKGPEVKKVLTMDTWFLEDPAFRKLELLAHLCAKFREQHTDPPEQIHLEWAINKTRDQLVCVQQKLREEQAAEQFTKQYSVMN